IHKLLGVNSSLYLPLLRDAECIGLLNLVGKRPNMFRAAEIAQAESFRDQALIAIGNARLFEAEQQRTRELMETLEQNARLLNELRERTDDLTESLEQQTATSEVLEVISNSPGEIEPVFHSMLEKAVRICQATFGNIYRWDGHEVELIASHNVP